MSRKKLVTIIAVCITVIIVTFAISLSGCGPAGEPVVSFPDPNLEAAIMELLNKTSGPIYASELAGITNFLAHDRGIVNLSGLQYCTHLVALGLGGNQISDISSLANLTSLSDLDLDSNQISDISPLANLINLELLNLDSNQISDVSALASLTSLTNLDLASNQISNILPIANLTKVTELWLGDNQINDISPLADLTNLTWLRLQSNQISDISPLIENAGLSEGDFVELEENPLSSDSINIYIPELEARGVTVTY